MKSSARDNWDTCNQLDYVDNGPYRHHNKKRLALINKFIEYHVSEPNPKILDVGCGDGVYLRRLVQIPGATVIGIDSNKLRTKRAKNIKGAIVLTMDIEEYLKKEEGFDFIFLHHVIEHMTFEKANDLLRLIYKRLTPYGILIVGAPNEGTWYWQLRDRIIQRSIMRDTDHKLFLTEDSLRAMLRSSGFLVMETAAMGGGLPHTRLDELVKRYKVIDDLLDVVGRIIPATASSLYAVATRR